MCGIVGIATSYTNGFAQDDIKTFRDMLFVDTLRGWDSTGIFGVTKENNVHIAKAAVDGPSFVKTKEFDSVTNKMWSNGLFLVGHNRAATRGTVKDANAHPFWVDDKIILVQNGTYFGSHTHHKNTEVDTEAIAHVISEEKDVGAALRKINAAYALVWYNTEEETLNLVRNDQRPLYVAREKDKNGFIFASEAPTILWAAGRNGIKLEAAPEMLPEFTLIKLQINKKRNYFNVSEEKVDGKYKYTGIITHYPYQAQRTHIGHACAYELDDVNTVGGAAEYPFLDKDTSTSTGKQHSSKDGKFDLSLRASEEFQMKPYENYHMPAEDAHKLLHAWCTKADKLDPEVVVEIEDFFPANTNSDCRTWWIYGKRVEIEGEFSQILFTWLVTGMTQEEVLNYCANGGIYRLKVNSIKVERFRIGGLPMGLVMANCTNPVNITTLSTSTN